MNKKFVAFLNLPTLLNLIIETGSVKNKTVLSKLFDHHVVVHVAIDVDIKRLTGTNSTI